MGEFQEISCEVRGGVARIELNRPESKNALSMTMRGELVTALRTAESDDSVAVIRLAGAGTSFCAGYDLKAPYGSRDDRAARGGWVSDRNLQGWTDQFARSCVDDWMTIWDLLKPVVVIAHGDCLGGGMELLAMADVAFVADDTRIGYPPVRAMATPDVPVFAWKMTMARAKYLQLTGNSISGAEAASWGMVAKSFPGEELVERADAEIEAMSSIDAGLLMANKHQVNQAYEVMGLRTHLRQAWAWHHLTASVRPGHGRFSEIAATQGLRAALEWMNQPFNDAGLR
jgi:enoyl-CoA hydratase